MDPCSLIIFGITGDLATRKLIPALYKLFAQQQLGNWICIGCGRRENGTAAFRQQLRQALEGFIDDESTWEAFSERLFYHQIQFRDAVGYQQLQQLLQQCEQRFAIHGNRTFYLSTPLAEIIPIIDNLQRCALLQRSNGARLIIEKPFGRDLHSARALQAEILQYVGAEQIYRIDHYLGKGAVQNLLPWRLHDPRFSPIWNGEMISHVQITAAETIGIGRRGHFFEQTGIVRDMIQNHLLQLLTLVAMEPPLAATKEAIQQQKIALLRAIVPLDLQNSSVRGQYGAGAIGSQPVGGYRQEAHVDRYSAVETYAALKLNIDTPRWRGTPFYLRAGKRLAKQGIEIAIFFKPAAAWSKSILRLRIQPEPMIALTACAAQQTHAALPGTSAFSNPSPEAYERLLRDALAGDPTLFVSTEEVLLAWQLLTPLLQFWQAQPAPFPNYRAGSWGPPESDRMLARDGWRWNPLL